jgi:predicted dehydrogenase
MEVYGREGTLIATSEDSPQLKEVKLQGVQGNGQLSEITVPARYTNVLEGMPRGEPFNVGQMYYRFGEAIRSGTACEPNFDTAVGLHQFIDNIRQSTDQGRRVAVTVG